MPEKVTREPGLRWTTETLSDFARQVAARMCAEKDENGERLCDEGFSCERGLPTRWPDGYRWVACYWVTGDSEGWYVHLDIVRGYRQSEDGVLHADVVHVGMCKTFLGAGRAAEIARRCAEIAGA